MRGRSRFTVWDTGYGISILPNIHDPSANWQLATKNSQTEPLRRKAPHFLCNFLCKMPIPH